MFAANEDIEAGINQLERVIGNLMIFFESHQLNLNATKTDFIISSKQSKTRKKYELTVSKQNVSHTRTIKHLGILLDGYLTYQVGVTTILKKTACGIKTLYTIRDFFPEKIRILLLNALVISKSTSVLICFTHWKCPTFDDHSRKTTDLGNKSNFLQTQV